MLILQCGGQMWPIEPWYLAHRAPHELGNLVGVNTDTPSHCQNPKPLAGGWNWAVTLPSTWLHQGWAMPPSLCTTRVGLGCTPFYPRDRSMLTLPVQLVWGQALPLSLQTSRLGLGHAPFLLWGWAMNKIFHKRSLGHASLSPQLDWVWDTPLPPTGLDWGWVMPSPPTARPSWGWAKPPFPTWLDQGWTTPPHLVAWLDGAPLHVVWGLDYIHWPDLAHRGTGHHLSGPTDKNIEHFCSTAKGSRSWIRNNPFLTKTK